MNSSQQESEVLSPYNSFRTRKTTPVEGRNSINQEYWSGNDVSKIVDGTYVPLNESRENPDIQFTPTLFRPNFRDKKNGSLEATLIKDNFEIRIGEEEFDLAISTKHTPRGSFYVVEKWINPFWKSQTRFWVPGEKNPLGEYLVILADESGNKIPQGIHQWIQWEYSSPDFKKGDFGSGCLRTRVEDMEKIYQALPLGSRIEIK